ncbi:MAG: hypothetical protein U7123_25155 [Potamolinea sp.]
MMNSEEAFKFVNSLFLEKTQKSLSDSEKDVFLGIWEGKTYKEIGEKNHKEEQTIKEIASAKLFKKINEIIEIHVRRNNFKTTIESYKQQQSQKDSPSPKSDDQLTNTETPETSQVNQDPAPRTPAIINPFIPRQGLVDNPQLFFNREREIRQIFEVLNSGSSVALIGEEGIGKSSLLWAICQQASIHLYSPRQPVFLDLNNVHNEDEFYSTLCDEIGIPDNRSRLNRNLKDKKVLLALDNVGKMTWEGFTRQVRFQLRGLAEGSKAPFKLILAATEPLDILFKDSQDESKTSPLAGICQQQDIKPWNDWREVLTVPQTTKNCYLQRQQHSRMSALRPRKTNTFCLYLIAFCLFIWLAVTIPVSAEPSPTPESIDTLRQIQEQIDQQRSNLSKERDRLSNVEQSMQGKLKGIQGNIQSTDTASKDYELLIKQANQYLKQLLVNLDKAQSNYYQKQAATIARLRFLQRQQIKGFGWDILLKSQNLNELLDRRRQVKLIYQADQQSLISLKTEYDRIKQQKSKIEEVKNQISLLNQQLFLQKAQFQEQLTAQQQLITRLNTDKQALKAAQQQLALDSRSIGILIKKQLAANSPSFT